MEYHVLNINYTPEEKQKHWETAIGLQKVDDLSVSNYLIELSQKEIAGELSNEEIEELLYQKYNNDEFSQVIRVKEADIVANRIAYLLKEPGFVFSPQTLKYNHRVLFDGIYKNAGEFRAFNISKSEPILGGKTVNYANYQMIRDAFAYDFDEEKRKSYEGLNVEHICKRLSTFSSSIWQMHAFPEGNTRTTAVFMEKYLNSLGFKVNNDYFSKYAKYYRNALVRSNYADYQNNVFPDNKYLDAFYENLLFGGMNKLQNRDMIVKTYFKDSYINSQI